METKILVTGASGFIARKLVKYFNSKGIQLHLLSRNKQPNIPGVFYWNPSTQEIDLKCLEGVSTIIHLAGAGIADHRWTTAYKNTILQSRISSTQLLLNTLKNVSHQVKHLISTSAIGYYESSLTINQKEDSHAGNSFLAKVCQEWENQSNAFNSIGIKVSIIRVGLVLSREAGMLKSIEFPAKFGMAAPFGNGKQMQSWIHIDDLIGIYGHVYHNGLTGIFNAVAPHPVSNNQLLESISKRLHRPFWLPGIPMWFMKLILGEIVDLLYASQRVSCEKIVQSGYVFKYEQLTVALAELYPNK